MNYTGSKVAEETNNSFSIRKYFLHSCRRKIMATARRRRAGQNFRPVMPQPSDMSRLTIGPGQKKKDRFTLQLLLGRVRSTTPARGPRRRTSSPLRWSVVVLVAVPHSRRMQLHRAVERKLCLAPHAFASRRLSHPLGCSTAG